MLALYDISVAFWHTQLPEDEPIANGEEEAGYMRQMKRAMGGTRRATRLFQEHMKGVLKDAGYAALKVCHQVYHCLETDSMAAIHGDDIIAKGEPDKLDRLDEVLKRLVVVKVPDRIGPGAAEHWTAPEEDTSCTLTDRDLSDWKIRNILLRSSENRSKVSSLGSKGLGRSDPEALDELEEVEAKLYHQNTGISIYVSSGRLAMQFCVKRLSEMITKPRKAGQSSTCKAGKIPCGYVEAHAQILIIRSTVTL